MQDKFLKLIENYKTFLKEEGNENEVYKWNAIIHFQKNWDFKASDFYGMFKEAFSKRENLIYQNSYGFLDKLGKVFPDKLKKLFSVILNNNSSFDSIYKSSRLLADEYLTELKVNLKRDNLSHQLDERTISFLRVLNNPEEDYLYKANVYDVFCDYLKVDKVNSAGAKYNHFEQLADSFYGVVKNDEELNDLVEDFIPENFQFDSTKLIVQDIIYNLLIVKAGSEGYDKLLSRLISEIQEELRNSNHPLMHHTWLDSKSKSYRLISIIPDVYKIPVYYIHYELYSYGGELCFEIHPEGDLAFKKEIKPFVESFAKNNTDYKLTKWFNHISKGDETRNTHKKIVPITKTKSSLNVKDYDRIKSELLLQFKKLYSDFNQPFLEYYDMSNSNVNVKKEFIIWLINKPKSKYFNNDVETLNRYLDTYNTYFPIDIFEITKSNYKDIIEAIYKVAYQDENSSFFKYSDGESNHRPRAILGKTNYFEFLKEKFSKSSLPNNIGYNAPLNQIFYGPPGTGKTYNTILESAKIINQNPDVSYTKALEIFNENLGDKIEFITFHQNYSYEDFIQGLRPDIDQKALSFNRADGVFAKIVTNALFEYYKVHQNNQKLPPNVIDIKIDLNDAFIEFLNSLEEGQEFETKTGAKIKVDNFTDRQNIEFRPINGVKSYLVSGNRLLKLYKIYDDIDKIKRVHEDIREAIGGCNSTIYYVALREFIDFLEKYKESVEEFVDDEENYDYEHISYRRKKELLSKLSLDELRSVSSDEVPNYVIIIDEINRANISRVFGELITLIEKDKRSHGTIPLKATLPSGESFIVPSNLYIIGTMNTADKSIALLDIALRRRFEFKSMYPQYKIEGKKIHESEFLEKLNKLIVDSGKGHDFTIGHSYFMCDDNETFSFEDTINNKVIPLMLEYYMNAEGEVKKILKEAGVNIGNWPLEVLPHD